MLLCAGLIRGRAPPVTSLPRQRYPPTTKDTSTTPEGLTTRGATTLRHNYPRAQANYRVCVMGQHIDGRTF